ncbi:MAG: hypothetical protein GKR94_17770 [Gammaproteobacteria bacterium]|nr:hypothetical protein [Gammaproteobacteria bacterium]
MKVSLKDRRALITAGGAGMGRATAIAMQKEEDFFRTRVTLVEIMATKLFIAFEVFNAVWH